MSSKVFCAFGDVFRAVFIREHPHVAEHGEAHQFVIRTKLGNSSITFGIANIQKSLSAKGGDHLLQYLLRFSGALLREHFLPRLRRMAVLCHTSAVKPRIMAAHNAIALQYHPHKGFILIHRFGVFHNWVGREQMEFSPVNNILSTAPPIKVARRGTGSHVPYFAA